MADVAGHDVVEKIMLRLNLKGVIRCKSVCKSWNSLITSPRFLNRHLNSYFNSDQNGNKLEYSLLKFVDEFYFHNGGHDDFVGYLNGLICISPYISKFLAADKVGRELRNLKLSPWVGLPLCLGFGYDLLRDDYKVIIGVRKDENQTCLWAWSLNRDVWGDIGKVKCRFITKVGFLCNGALHWIVKYDENMPSIIFSYDLSGDEFKEIPLRDDDPELFSNTLEEHGLPWDYHAAPIFVKSLVSPHVTRKPRYNKASSVYCCCNYFYSFSNRIPQQLIEGGPEPSARV